MLRHASGPSGDGNPSPRSEPRKIEHGRNGLPIRQLPRETISFLANPMPKLEAASRKQVPKGFRACDIIQMPGAGADEVEKVKSALQLASSRLMDDPNYPKVHLDHYDSHSGAFVRTVTNPLVTTGVTDFEEEPDLSLHGVVLAKHKQMEIWNYKVAREMLVKEANTILASEGVLALPDKFPDPPWSDV